MGYFKTFLMLGFKGGFGLDLQPTERAFKVAYIPTRVKPKGHAFVQRLHVELIERRAF